MHRLVGLLGPLLLAVALVPAPAAAGSGGLAGGRLSAISRPDDPHDDYKRAQAQLKQAGAALDGATKKAADAVARYQATAARLPAAQDRVAQAQGAVVAAGVQADTARRTADSATLAQHEAENTVAQRNDQVAAARGRLSSFAVAAYTGSAVAEFNMLLEVRDPGDMVQRIGYLQRITETERSAIDRARAARLAAQAAANSAELARRRAVDAQAAARERLADAQAAQDEATAAVSALAQLVTDQKAAAAAADAQRAAVLQQYNEQKAESERIAADLRAWERAHAATPAPVLQPGARLLTPVAGWKSSDFGMRYDPYYHVWQLHAGVDLAADEGTPIYAAAAGTVTYAGWAGGYGNYTCVRHGLYRGRTMSTCYGHQSRILVDVGQRVRQGQLIGRVGTTGASTGDHLHFEVRFDGDPVNPLPYLPSCLC
ncbi:peptidoglycan DD-metalloendopeptidase family protein [Hamadaea tsunoensis]|uniref:peptidoglycan DD-metalloendopeptidase family protein n=1 Tax=Hamadaea tsunoensis TaxID=53368 RepID=UPI000410AFE4|nr:M23 family metallopeptidase [Hamadaea tsunoensis]